MIIFLLRFPWLGMEPISSQSVLLAHCILRIYLSSCYLQSKLKNIKVIQLNFIKARTSNSESILESIVNIEIHSQISMQF